MTRISPYSESQRSGGLTFLSVVNAIALVITVLFWGMVFSRRLVPFPADLTSLSERANAAVTYGFMIGDLLYSAPLLLLLRSRWPRYSGSGRSGVPGSWRTT